MSSRLIVIRPPGPLGTAGCGDGALAGTGWRDNPMGYLTRGGTGYGVRLLAEVLAGFRKPKRR